MRARTVIGAFLSRKVESLADDFERVQVSRNADAEAYSEFMRTLPGVESAEPNRYWRLVDFSMDPLEPKQWAPPKISAREAWEVASGSGVVVAILDTGVDSSHPDLAGRVLKGRNFTGSDSTDVMDRHGHGTHVAGIVAATAGNGQGVVGTAPAAYILPVKVIGDNGYGKTDWIVSGLRWAIDNGAKVISLSFGSTNSSSAMNKELERAWTKGIVIVAAAGNNNSSTKFYPAAYERAIAVAATTKDDSKTTFSNYGAWVDVAAPGSQVLSTFPGREYRTMSGTSMAAPHVAGLAAVLISKLGASATPSTVRELIERTTDAVSTPGTAAYGRIDMAAAVGNRRRVEEETQTEHQCLDLKSTIGSTRGFWLNNLVESDNRRVLVRAAHHSGSYRTESIANFSVRAPEFGGLLSIDFELSSSRPANAALWTWNVQTSEWDLLAPVSLNRLDQSNEVQLSSYTQYISNGKMLLKITSESRARHDVLVDQLFIRSEG